MTQVVCLVDRLGLYDVGVRVVGPAFGKRFGKGVMKPKKVMGREAGRVFEGRFKFPNGLLPIAHGATYEEVKTSTRPEFLTCSGEAIHVHEGHLFVHDIKAQHPDFSWEVNSALAQAEPCVFLHKNSSIRNNEHRGSRKQRESTATGRISTIHPIHSQHSNPRRGGMIQQKDPLTSTLTQVDISVTRREQV